MIDEALYRKVIKVTCPYFNKDISFNSKGLNHLKFNGQGKARTSSEQKMRMNLFLYAPKILSKSHTVQGILLQEKIEKIRKDGKTLQKRVLVSFYEFMAVIDDKRIKVIVKQISEGNLYFWSVIPYWKKTAQGRKIDSIDQHDLF